ncbi:hypothetical protein Hanom_Chr13g01191261 [Helianthus anomalus]
MRVCSASAALIFVFLLGLQWSIIWFFVVVLQGDGLALYGLCWGCYFGTWQGLYELLFMLLL